MTALLVSESALTSLSIKNANLGRNEPSRRINRPDRGCLGLRVRKGDAHQPTGLKVVGNRVSKADAGIPQEVRRFHKGPEGTAVRRFLSINGPALGLP